LHDEIVSFCRELGRAFAEGDFETLIAAYRYPLAISAPCGWRLEDTAEATRTSVFTRRAAALATGMRRIDVSVGEIAETGAGRLKVDVTWRYLGADDNELGRSLIRYFCVAGPETGRPLSIEVIEFLEIAFSGVPPDGWQTGHRPS
jgi:hypothetical protein